MLHRNVDINKRPKISEQWCIPTSVPRLHLCLQRTDRKKTPSKVQRHALTYRDNYSSSAYAQHLTNHGLSLGHMEDVRNIIFTTLGRYLDTVGRYYKKTEKDVQINDKSTITKNKIFRADSSTRLPIDGTILTTSFHYRKTFSMP